MQKRMHELRHAQEIRQIYEEKIKRVNKMEKNLFSFLEDIQIREEVYTFFLNNKFNNLINFFYLKFI